MKLLGRYIEYLFNDGTERRSANLVGSMPTNAWGYRFFDLIINDGKEEKTNMSPMYILGKEVAPGTVKTRTGLSVTYKESDNIVILP